MANKQVDIEQPDSKRINLIMMGLDDNGVITHVEIAVNVETEMDQVTYEPMTSSLRHLVSEFSDTVRNGLDLIPNEAIDLFCMKETFSDP